MTPEDLAAIHAAAFSESRAWSASEIASLKDQPHVHLVTSATGFALLQILPPEAEILTIAIDPVHQGKGFGRALLVAAMSRARDAGATRLFLEVDAVNMRARRLYETTGFTETARRTGYFAHSDGSRSDALVLSCSLSPREAGCCGAETG